MSISIEFEIGRGKIICVTRAPLRGELRTEVHSPCSGGSEIEIMHRRRIEQNVREGPTQGEDPTVISGHVTWNCALRVNFESVAIHSGALSDRRDRLLGRTTDREQGSRKPKPFITIHRKAMHRVREIGKEEESELSPPLTFSKSLARLQKAQEAGNRSWGYTESEERQTDQHVISRVEVERWRSVYL